MESNTNNTNMLRGLIIAVTCTLALATGISNAQYLSGRYLGAPGLAPTATVGSQSTNRPTQRAASSAQDAAPGEQYCSDSNYVDHYYNYYYGNRDSRDFFYFQRDWASVCGK
jgi:hypothetical protein